MTKGLLSLKTLFNIDFIGRVPQADQILYQTERYHGATFGYDMPVSRCRAKRLSVILPFL